MKLFLGVIGAILVSSVTLLAQEIDALTAKARIIKQSATLSGDRGGFTVSGSETLNKGQFSFGAGWSNFDRTPKDMDINVAPVHASFGILSRLTLSGMFEVRKEITARNVTQSGYYGALPFVTTARHEKGIGDGVAALKYRIRRSADNVGGIALKGFVKFGTADSAKGLGTERTDVGAELLFTSLLPLNFAMHSSLGYVWTQDARTSVTRKVQDQLVTGLAAVWPASGISAGGKLQGIVEYSSTTFVGCCSSANAATTKIQNPSDVNAGIRYLLLDSGLTLDAAYRINTRFDETDRRNTERNGFIAGVSFTKPSSTGYSNNRPPLVAVEASTTEVTGAGTVNLTATGFDADNDRLSYTWSATGGQVTGAGATATYRPSGGARGVYTVRVLASDGNGGTGSAEVDITVR